jgi:hypothetical protein
MIKVHCKHDKMVEVGKLKPNPENPNKHPEKQIDLLAQVIKEHGWRAPVTVSKRSGFIVRGHGRYYAALALGEKKVPVDHQDYDSDELELADLAADNRIAELAEKDEDLLTKLLRKVDDSDLEIELTGYTSQELDRMIEKQNRSEAQKPEVEFSEELHESSNYVVLYFDNDIDWLQALTLFDLKTVKALDSKPGFEKMGIGRVLNGSKALNQILNMEAFTGENKHK